MNRRAVKTDAAAISEIWNHTIRATTITFTPTEKSVEEVATLLNGETPCYVYEQDGVVLGFARYFPFRGGEGYKFSVEHTIMLADTAKGRGIGRALMADLIADAQTSGKHAMIAGISGENLGAIAFHEKCGFTALAVLPEVGFKFGRWLDLVLMQKRL